jgi:hypothetical protein
VSDLETAVLDDVRALIRQTLMWIWKDEQLHFEFMRGLLLESGGLTSSLVVYSRALQGYQTFRRYCTLNVALEASAEFAYRRLVELARSEWPTSRCSRRPRCTTRCSATGRWRRWPGTSASTHRFHRVRAPGTVHAGGQHGRD